MSVSALVSVSVSVSVSAAGLGGVFGVSFDVLRLVGAAGWELVAGCRMLL